MIEILLRFFVHTVTINNYPALFYTMTWRRNVSEPMMAQFTDAYLHHLSFLSVSKKFLLKKVDSS